MTAAPEAPARRSVTPSALRPWQLRVAEPGAGGSSPPRRDEKRPASAARRSAPANRASGS